MSTQFWLVAAPLLWVVLVLVHATWSYKRECRMRSGYLFQYFKFKPVDSEAYDGRKLVSFTWDEHAMWLPGNYCHNLCLLIPEGPINAKWRAHDGLIHKGANQPIEMFPSESQYMDKLNAEEFQGIIPWIMKHPNNIPYYPPKLPPIESILTSSTSLLDELIKLQEECSRTINEMVGISEAREGNVLHVQKVSQTQRIVSLIKHNIMNPKPLISNWQPGQPFPVDPNAPKNVSNGK